MNKETLSNEMLGKMNAYWRAANYLSVGQIYLYDNPLSAAPIRYFDHAQKAEARRWLEQE